MAEVLINTMGGGRFKAYSAGSKPTDDVHPLALEQVREIGYPVEGLRSKSWNEFAQPAAPQMDFIITVCDNAAGEDCPIWPGQPLTAHWGIEDPAAVQGTDEQKRRAFAKAFAYLMNRVQLFVNLPLTVLDPIAMKREMDDIGRTKGDVT